MVMRLLKKKEIDKLKAADRKREIDEGVKLARRVDGLRETSAKEEASLEQYRTATLASIGAEIIEATNKRDTLSKEVKEYEERKTVALVPLTAQWKELEEEKATLAEEQASWTKRREGWEDAELDLKERKRQIGLEEHRLHLRGISVQEDLQKSAKLMASAEQASKESATSAKTRTLELDDRERGLVSRETSVNNREKNASIREAEQDIRERELNKLETKLRDRTKMASKKK